MHPVSLWTSLMQLGALMLVMVEIFSGLDLLGVGFDAAMADDEAE
jgi:hypothetical protein